MMRRLAHTSVLANDGAKGIRGEKMREKAMAVFMGMNEEIRSAHGMREFLTGSFVCLEYSSSIELVDVSIAE
jgi:hypothetical protein